MNRFPFSPDTRLEGFEIPRHTQKTDIKFTMPTPEVSLPMTTTAIAFPVGVNTPRLKMENSPKLPPLKNKSKVLHMRNRNEKPVGRTTQIDFCIGESKIQHRRL